VSGPATGPRVVIGVNGSGTHEGTGPLKADEEASAEAAGRAIAQRGDATLTGGAGGVMAAGLGRGRNLVVVRAPDALVMIGGSVGTLHELAIACAEGTPVVVLRGTCGWSDRLPSVLVDGAYRDEWRTMAVDVRDGAVEAVERAFERANQRRGVASYGRAGLRG
jgi:predicted Rossmann-fold nucleotide-binding protein